MKNLFNPIFLAGSTLFMQGTWLYAQEEHPNIIWITCEDISPYMKHTEIRLSRLLTLIGWQPKVSSFKVCIRLPESVLQAVLV